MAKLLLTWEAGTHLGHEMQVTAAAAALRAAGHEAVIFAPDGAPANAAARKAGVRWENLRPLPSQGLRQLAQSAPATGFDWHSRATALWGLGFHSAGVIRDRLSAWHEVFQQERPDAALLQAAPFAQLAAHAAGLPSIEFGIGFDVPPLQSPFPAFRNAGAFDSARATALEQSMLERIAAAQAGSRGAAASPATPAPTVQTLHGHVSGPKRLVVTLPELDHYPGHSDSSREFIGPLPLVDLAPAAGEAPPPAWRQTGGGQSGKPRVLAYLRADLLRAPEQLIQAIGSLRGDAVVVCFGADDATVQQAQALGIRLHLEPISILGLLDTADLVVSHGGGGLIAAAAARGRPCAVLPSNYEQFMTGTALMRHRLGTLANPMEPARYEVALRMALTSPEVRRSTATVAARWRGRHGDAGAALVQAAEQLVSQSR